jgi:AraC-like DNA-binding protein
MTGYRCKLIVEKELENLGIQDAVVKLGVVEVQKELTEAQYNEIEERLYSVGLEILHSKSTILAEKIKLIIINIIYYTLDFPKTNFSDYLTKKLGYNYIYLSNTFSSEVGISIRKFIIYNKIEKIKEFLLHEEMTLTEIAFNLDYSSVAHLSAQFKKETGMTPTQFKAQGKPKRNPLDNLQSE